MDTGRIVKIALAGNPNCGKSTVFNALTGSHQHVGNYPGVTVDRKVGEFEFDGRKIELIDLPGAYSLTAYTQEELVTRGELARGGIASVINIVEASALERNLLLTVQLREMGLPLVLACNMMDEAAAGGVRIDLTRLGELLGAPTVPMIAKTGKGVKDSLLESIRLAESPKPAPLVISYGPDVDVALLEMESVIENSGLLTEAFQPRFLALKFLENDPEVIRTAEKINSEASAKLTAITRRVGEHVRETLNADLESIITDHRFGFIYAILKDGVVERDPARDRLAITDKIDRVLTNAFLGPLFMLAVLYFMYEITFEIGAWPQGWIEDAFSWIGDGLNAILPDGLVRSLLVDGMIAGVGSVLSFVPLIMIMFALISFMEDSGYMARMAYMMDRIFRFFGLHGASVMPYVISGGIAGGCAIPGAMATRTLRSPREKLATLLTLPYMTCGAKLPIFLLLSGAFFPEHAAMVMFCIMLAGWVFALLVARLLRSTLVRGQATPFVMELPPYRTPTLRGVLVHSWERAWQYIKKAGTVILAISVLIWAALTFPRLPASIEADYNARISQIEERIPEIGEESANAQIEELEHQLEEDRLAYSVGGRMGKAIAPLTAPAGFDWRVDIALIAGVAAKEAVVSTMGTALALGEQDPEDAEPLGELLKADPAWNHATALALMLFVLLYSPCFVALVVIKNESGSWAWLAFSVVFNTLLAYGVAVAVYQATSRLWL